MILLALACSPEAGVACVLPPDAGVDYAEALGCWEDFAQLAAEPLDASLPGAWSVKTIVDRVDGDHLYFQDSEAYPIHWDFASTHLSGGDLPIVPDLATFNATEYYSPDRRFILGAVTRYDEPGVWAYEIAPYDTADAGLVATAFRAIREAAWFGDELLFHPSSTAVEAMAATLPDDIPVITTDELFAGITYQPLNLGSAMGRLARYTVEELETTIPDYREIVVLDAVPNDIDIVSGIITAAFQTPLSHINVLSQNRGTPNMALADALEDPQLAALTGAWVELTVDAMSWSIREVTREEADAWWEEHKPDPLPVTPMDLSVTELTDDVDILDLDHLDLADALAEAIPAFGGKAAHFGGLARIGDAVPHPDAFAIPVYYYDQFMRQNGFWDQVGALLADPDFTGDPEVRATRLAELQEAMRAAPVDPDFLQLVLDRLAADHPGERMRFRSSTNAEDLNGFNGAGLYTSTSGDPDDPDAPVDAAIKEVWASIWNPRAFDERAYYSIDHTQVGMAILVHPAFLDEEANGVAITANIYDTTGLEPGFYVNVQEGEASVVEPDPGVTTDQLVYYYDLPGQPVVYLQHSNLVPEGETVLTSSELYELGGALSAIHAFFAPVYDVGEGFYGMDVEFKFDGFMDEPPHVQVKQARPYPGW